MGIRPCESSSEDPADGQAIDETVAARIFDTVVFGVRSAEAVERELDLYLRQEIAGFDFVCDLTEAQKKKLLLAGRSAVKKIGDRVDDRRREVQLVRAGEFDAVKRRIQADATPLRDVLHSDPLHAESIFWKVGTHVLMPEQAVRMRLFLGTDRVRGVLLHATPSDGQHPIRKIRFPATPFDDNDLSRVANVKSLQGLVLSATQVTDSGLPHLARLTNLEELDLGDTRINGTGFGHIRELKRLRDVDLRRTRVTDDGLAIFVYFPICGTCICLISISTTRQ